MGLDLRLLPENYTSSNFSHTMISLDRDYELYDKIIDLVNKSGFPVQDGFNSYMSYDSELGGHVYGLTIQDDYGEKLKGVYAKDLKEVFCIDLSPVNSAAKSYLSQLDGNNKVYLYWH